MAIRTRAGLPGPLRPHAIEWMVVIEGAVLVAVVVRTFVIQTFWIPTWVQPLERG